MENRDFGLTFVGLVLGLAGDCLRGAQLPVAHEKGVSDRAITVRAMRATADGSQALGLGEPVPR